MPHLCVFVCLCVCSGACKGVLPVSCNQQLHLPAGSCIFCVADCVSPLFKNDCPLEWTTGNYQPE